MRILYVEDNETNQALVERVARARKHEILFEEDGESALEVLAQDAAINLILLDIELAGRISGLEVVKTLRARRDKRPIVAVTAYAMMGDRERMMAAGCDQYLPKPLIIPDLLAVIDHYDADLQSALPEPAPQAVQPLTPPVEAPAPAAPPAVQPPTTAVEAPAVPPPTPAVEPAAPQVAQPAAPAVPQAAEPATVKPAVPAVEIPAPAAPQTVEPATPGVEPAAPAVPETLTGPATPNSEAPV